MYKAYKFRLYPNIEQQILINKTIGCTRFIYNYFLSGCKKNGYKKVYEMCKEIKELMKKEKRLKRLQRKLARQIKESNNYKKTRIKIADIYSKIKNSRKHNLITIVNKLVKENDIIVSENLFVQKMHNTHDLTKYIRDASFHKIINLLKWKCSLRGKYYYQVDKYYPSSKICSHCGEKANKTEDLSIRSWECDRCHHINDRDINASINIMDEGIRLHYCS